MGKKKHFETLYAAYKRNRGVGGAYDGKREMKKK